MEQCPRCGGAVEELSLGEASTVACPHCGFADVPVEHQPEGEDRESWRDAFNRFYEESADDSRSR